MTEFDFIKLGPKAKDLTHKTFSRLTVLGPLARDKNYMVTWACRCECGNETVVAGTNLTRGNTTSCGCFRSDFLKEEKTTHGMTGTAEHKAWLGLRKRCNNHRHNMWGRYGGRGIRYAERWDDFTLFLADVGHRPSPAHSIDRRDNDGDYTPENCRWATPTEQANNTSRSRFITVRGVTKTLAQWARITGINYSTLYRRLVIARWPVEKALTRDATH